MEREAIHLVKRGETLGKIASLAKTTVAELAEINGIKNPNLIRVGEEVRVG